MSMDPLPSPNTYLPSCPNCGPDEERDEWSCERCKCPVPVCENCRTFIADCGCGHCQTGDHAVEEGEE